MGTPWNPNYKRKSKTHTSTEVKDRWNKKSYDTLTFRCRKGGREIIKAMAELRGLSLAEYLRHLVIQDAKNAEKGDISAFLGGGGDLSDFIARLTASAINL